MVKHLLSCADRFDAARLRSLCEVRLAAQLEIETVCETLVLADACHAKDLQERCLDFIVSKRAPMHSDQLIASEGFKSLKQRPELLVELLRVSQGGCRSNAGAAADSVPENVGRKRPAGTIDCAGNSGVGRAVGGRGKTLRVE
eukprot:SAG11_NODE_309_length_10941_cov_5.580520_4_plen_143_part_00